MRREEWNHPMGGRVVLLGSVFGLASEGDQVRDALEDVAYERLLLGISREALRAIEEREGEPPVVDPEDLEPLTQLYLAALTRFGPVAVPAPELYAAWRHATRRDVPVTAIDLSDAAHTEAYVDNVSVWETIRKERRQRKRARRVDETSDVHAFAAAWDDVFFPTKGLRRVERERERHMAHQVLEASQGGVVAAIVPDERLDGILAHLAAFEDA